jgi:cellulose biosynthesis protein BcsQ
MTKTISVFNNKGGVGKSTICWNVADALGRMGKTVLLIDFDPQCNLSLAVLGESTFIGTLPTQNTPYGITIRSFLQRFLQNTGGEQVFLHQGANTHSNVHLVAGDFWLNVYAEALNVGADLLTGTGLSRYVALRRIIELAKITGSIDFDYVLIDLPPSFGALVRAAFYSSDYYIVPCTSDNFSVYCVGLIGQMVPDFINDWSIGIQRFKQSNPHFTDFDTLGKPVFGGWVFNGFDTARTRRSQAEIQAGASVKNKQMVQADQTMHDRIETAITVDLVRPLNTKIQGYTPVASGLGSQYLVGDIEDANVLAQNSLLLNVPIGQLDNYQQVTALQARSTWAYNQIDQIKLINQKFTTLATNIIKNCI